MKTKIVNFLKRLAFFFPSKLPSGATEFEAFASDIITTYGLPNNDSFRWIIAQLLMHFDRQNSYKWQKMLFGNGYGSKRYFYLEIRGAEARQTGGQLFVQIKENDQKKRAAAEAAAQQSTASPAAVTPAPALSVVPSGPQGT